MKKTILLTLMTIFVVNLSIAQTPVTKSILDFGATGDGTTDDSHAFLKAWLFFTNQRSITGSPVSPGTNVDYANTNGILEIPSQINGVPATYMVGLQLSQGEYITLDYTLQGGGVVVPQNLDNILINTPWTSLQWSDWNLQNPATLLPAGYGSSYVEKPVVLMDMNASKFGLIDGFTIIGTGTGTPLIKYKSGFYYGTYEYTVPATNPPVPKYMTLPNNSQANQKYTAQVGTFFFANNAKNITIENIEIDGNNSTLIPNLGGQYGDIGWQIQPNGLDFQGTSENININNVKVSNMGLDGLILRHSTKNVTVSNSDFIGNGRCGISWVGGDNVAFTACTSSNNGYFGFGLPAQITGSSPNAGIDIEPEDPLSNGTFTDCNFINNKGRALVSDYESGTQSVTFENCTFHDVDGYAVQIRGPQFTFDHCRIWGGFVFGNKGDVIGDETKFYSCDFADEEIPGVNFGSNLPALVESEVYAKRLLFDECTFRLIHPNRKFIFIRSAAAANAEDEYSTIKNCHFTVESTASLNAATNVLASCMFDGNNYLTNNSSSLCKISTNGLVFKGSSDQCNPYSLTLEGKMNLFHANTNGLSQKFVFGRNDVTGGNDKYFNFNINPSACLYTYWGTNYDIGRYSTLLNKGQIISVGGAFNNDGKIVFDNGSYNKICSTANNTNTGLNAEFYIHKNIDDNLNNSLSINAIWAAYGPISTVWTPNMYQNNAKFDGGNTAHFGNYLTAPYEAYSLNPGNPTAGTTERVDIPSNAKFNYAPLGVILNPPPANPTYITGSDFTIEIPFKRGNTAKGCLFSQGSIFEIGINSSNKIYVQFPYYPNGANGSTLYVVNNTTINTGECHTLCLKREGGTLKVSLDGAEIHTIGANSSILTTANDAIKLGYGTVGNYFNGWIGQVRIWNRSLPACEVKYNYNRKAPFDANGLVADWDMSCLTNTCTTITDAAPTPVNGTLMASGIPMVSPTGWIHQSNIGDCSLPYMNFKTDETNNQEGMQAIDMNDNVSLYPNPNTGKFTISLQGIEGKTANIVLYDLSGRVISKNTVELNPNGLSKKEIDLSNPPKGIYFLKISGKNYNKSRTFIVE